MLLRQLKYFLAVVETGSFTAAAEQCYISQPAISQQIQALERDLGVELLCRGNRKFTLTAAGAHFYQKVRPLLEELERLCQETAGLAQPSAPQLRIGYLRCYSGPEFQLAVAEFTHQNPDVAVEIISGNHEELYEALRLGHADIILSDQRRAFSDAYVNQILTASRCCIEISSRSPLAQREYLTAEDLRGTPCILIASPNQQEIERTYYREIVGLDGEFLFADHLEQARLLAVGGKGYLPVDGTPQLHTVSMHLRRLPLLRDGKPILRNYCVFWKTGSQNPYTDCFAGILQQQFHKVQQESLPNPCGRPV